MQFCKPAALAAASIIALGGCAGTHVTPAATAYSPQFQGTAVAQAAKAVPAGPVQVYPIGDRGVNDVYLMDLKTGADGKLYFATTPAASSPTSGEIGWFDPAKHNQHYQQTSGYAPAFIQETSDGTVWVDEYNNASGTPTIDSYAGIGGALTAIPIPVGPFTGGSYNGLDGELAIAPDGGVWFGSANSSQVGRIDPLSDNVSVYGVTAPGDPWAPLPQHMTMGSDGSLWATDIFNDGVDSIAVSGSNQGSSTFTQLPQGPWTGTDPIFLQGIAQASDRNLYTGDPAPQSGGSIDYGKATPSPSFTPLPLPADGVLPDLLATAPGKVYFSDHRFGALGIRDVTAHTTVLLPLQFSVSAVGPLAVDGNGTPWVGCRTRTNGACIESVALSSVWNVFPGTTLVMYSSDPNGNTLPVGLLGIGETGNSGPFAVSSSGVCTAAIINGYDHDVQVNPLATGRCTVSITDAHARTVKVNVYVMHGSGWPPAFAPNPLLTAPARRPAAGARR